MRAMADNLTMRTIIPQMFSRQPVFKPAMFLCADPLAYYGRSGKSVPRRLCRPSVARVDSSRLLTAHLQSRLRWKPKCLVKPPGSSGEYMGRSAVMVLFIAALPAAAPLLAQNAELSGVVSDPSGLAVPGAKVVVQSAATGATRTVSANGQGEYSVPALLPGAYNITVDANGFKTLHQNGVVVEVDQRARLDFSLAVGSNTETVTVVGGTPLLNTSDASVSTVIDHQFVENL